MDRDEIKVKGCKVIFNNTVVEFETPQHALKFVSDLVIQANGLAY